jgi:hypothetical protein
MAGRQAPLPSPDSFRIAQFGKWPFSVLRDLDHAGVQDFIHSQRDSGYISAVGQIDPSLSVGSSRHMSRSQHDAFFTDDDTAAVGSTDLYCHGLLK